MMHIQLGKRVELFCTNRLLRRSQSDSLVQARRVLMKLYKA